VNLISTRSGSAQASPGRRRGRPAEGRSRGTRLLHGRPGDPAWARPALLALLLATAVLYLSGLSRNGYANEFYAAAVQAGTKSWKAFLFGSVDSSNFITVDKTPASLWVMELSGRLFGFSSWSLLVPQALEGVATVGVLYATVRRWFSPAAAIIAGAVAALTPVAVLMFRFDNPDALLVLVMTLAAYTITRAIESGLTRWIVLTGALLGFGYLTKMLQAFLVLPVFALAYLWAGQPSLGKRLWQLLAGLAGLVAAAGWWVAIVLLTPAADRPYVGGSTENNILQLTFGYNGLGRLTGSENSAGGGGGTTAHQPSGAAARLGEGAAQVGGSAARVGGSAARLGEGAVRASGAPPGGGGAGGGNPLFGGATGITRLFHSDMGSQISWLLPAALIALAALLWLSWRSPRRDRTRAAALVWGGWLVLTGVVFSYMSGIIHPYYTVALVPAIAALTGIGATALWQLRHTWTARLILAGTLLVTATWAWVLLDRTPGWFPWLKLVIGVAAAAGAVMILAGPDVRAATVRGRTGLVVAPLSLALIAGLGGPLAYSIDTAATTHGGSIPTAGPTVAGSSGGPGTLPGSTGSSRAGQSSSAESAVPRGMSGTAPSGPGPARASGARGAASTGGTGSASSPGSVSRTLSRLLESGASGYRWAAATISSTSAASLELGSNGVPVMAIGGFTGSDPAPALAQFEKLVSAHEIHYFVSSGTGAGTGAGGPGGSSGSGSRITTWVKAHFTARTVGGMTVYDLTTPE
jgi:4-amino-4-deoxy-L-arabinose transferase-like glycosyltransferase